MIFDLTQDFSDAVAAMPRGHPRHRMLELLEEAIRRDIHFIGRHPTTLFQCMWNTCWWYDCPEVHHHIINAGELARSGWIPPWEREQPRFYAWMHDWRLAKQRLTPGFSWLRSLRPPYRNLGTGCSIVLTGHSGHIAGVCVSDDCRTMASIDRSGCLHVWNTAPFREIGRVEAYQGLNVGRTFGVVIGPGAAWLASYGVDDRFNQQNYRSTVRVWDPVSLKKCAEAEARNEITALCYSHDTGQLYGASRGMLYCWDPKNLKEILSMDTGQRQISVIATSASGTVWLAGDDGKKRTGIVLSSV